MSYELGGAIISFCLFVLLLILAIVPLIGSYGAFSEGYRCWLTRNNIRFDCQLMTKTSRIQQHKQSRAQIYRNIAGWVFLGTISGITGVIGSFYTIIMLSNIYGQIVSLI